MPIEAGSEPAGAEGRGEHREEGPPTEAGQDRADLHGHLSHPVRRADETPARGDRASHWWPRVPCPFTLSCTSVAQRRLSPARGLFSPSVRELSAPRQPLRLPVQSLAPLYCRAHEGPSRRPRAHRTVRCTRWARRAPRELACRSCSSSHRCRSPPSRSGYSLRPGNTPGMAVRSREPPVHEHAGAVCSLARASISPVRRRGLRAARHCSLLRRAVEPADRSSYSIGRSSYSVDWSSYSPVRPSTAPASRLPYGHPSPQHPSPRPPAPHIPSTVRFIPAPAPRIPSARPRLSPPVRSSSLLEHAPRLLHRYSRLLQPGPRLLHDASRLVHHGSSPPPHASRPPCTTRQAATQRHLPSVPSLRSRPSASRLLHPGGGPLHRGSRPTYRSSRLLHRGSRPLHRPVHFTAPPVVLPDGHFHPPGNRAVCCTRRRRPGETHQRKLLRSSPLRTSL